MKSTEPTGGKMDSFFGNRSVVLSKKQRENVRKNACLGGLYLTDIGFYPHASRHYRKRKKGIKEHILIYCVDGTGFIQVGENIHQLEPNTYFIIPSHTAHAYWASENSAWSIYWIHFGGKRSNTFEVFFSKVISIEPTVNSRIEDRINQINEVLNALESGFSTENINYANLCLNGLLASFFFPETYRLVKGVQSTDPVDQSIFFMQKNLNEMLKISDIAKYVKLSESHLTKLFRNKTGSSPLDYFINLKLQEAIRLLTNQSLKVKEVAFMLGYNDPHYFTRLFTKHIGTSPAYYVKMSRW